MPHSKEKLLEDILIAIQDIESFSKGKTFDDYKSDKLLQSAIERQLEIIGEALYRRCSPTHTLLNPEKARSGSGLFDRKPTTEMSAFYDLNPEKHPKILRPQFEQSYDRKKSVNT